MKQEANFKKLRKIEVFDMKTNQRIIDGYFHGFGTVAASDSAMNSILIVEDHDGKLHFPEAGYYNFKLGVIDE